MFYSQFILAKKGPLGTIWIAAHLERKLRKNQVADTDIGVSVDSILFPDVPIALRLSSHLLLGVVRIYSRKVGYLFDDCSEALLKVKQAFRSTAVDLPPEESTAPYHSITLPETFDLDDFELPDNEIFQGNYVDHHVSTKEQITLQDTMDGVVYSTSQFGLDERFGDGDASQIGLDLEEDLFLNKNAAQDHDGDLDADLQASVQPMTLIKKDNSNEGMSETWEAMAVDEASEYQIQGLTANSDVIEYAQAPSTPGLVEVPNVSSVQEALASDDHLEMEHLTLTEKSVEKDSTKSDIHHEDQNAVNDELNHDTPLCIPPKENGHIYSDLENEHAEHQGDGPSIAKTMAADDGTIGALDGPDMVEDVQNGVIPSMDKADKECVESGEVGLKETGASLIVSEGHLEDNQVSLKPGTEGNVEESHSPSNAVAADGACVLQTSDRPDAVNDEAQACAELKDPSDEKPDTVNDEKPSVSAPVLRSCTSHMNQSDDGENAVILPDVGSHSIETSITEEVLRASVPSAAVQGDETVEPAISKDALADSRELDSTDYQLENATAYEFPAPEMMLSAPNGDIEPPNALLLDSTPDKEALTGSTVNDGMQLISGKKRSFTESTVTFQSLNSDESFGLTRSKRTAESIPNDDDLLSSILVGRRSTALKLKLTPSGPDVTSMKRVRSAPRPSASKRKVLMDDPMVLHGDTIRLQLMSTEDIRRVRKKAPCTRPEISMIERQFLEDEIFSQPISAGMSTELNCLHSEKHDLSRISVSVTCENNNSSEAAKEIESPSRLNVTEETEIQEGIETTDVRSEVEAQPIETLPLTDVPELKTAEDEPCGESAQMDIDRECLAPTDAANDFIPGTEVSYAMDTSCLSPAKKSDTDPVEDAFVLEIADQKDGATDVAELDAGNNNLVDSEFGAIDDFPKESNGEPSIDIRANSQIDCSVCDDQTANETGERKLEVVDEDKGFSTELGCDEKNLASEHLHGEEEHRVSDSIELDVGVPNASFNEGDISGYQETEKQSTLEWNAEVLPSDQPPLEDHSEFGNLGVENNTDFLNVDDDEVAEEEDEYEPYTEDATIPENSGWSSRTRAVSKYLQTMFDKEASHGRKVLPMDNLLAGKTRKEASRMFFETLVLKTRDFIHVEQAKPFDNIDIKPRLKLMKSIF